MGGVLKGVGNFLWGEQPEADFSLENMKRPDRITYKGLTDAQGNLADKYKLSSGEGYRGIAQGRLSENLAQARERAAKESAGAAAQARNAAAQRGGAQAGMQNLMAREQMQNLVNAGQGITRGGLEEGQKIEEKTFDIGREAEKVNLGNLIGDVRGQQAFNENMYGLDMAEYGASRTADAMKRNAPRPKGGVLGGITQGVGGILGKG